MENKGRNTSVCPNTLHTLENASQYFENWKGVPIGDMESREVVLCVVWRQQAVLQGRSLCE